jgi:hypothetical protein
VASRQGALVNLKQTKHDVCFKLDEKRSADNETANECNLRCSARFPTERLSNVLEMRMCRCAKDQTRDDQSTKHVYFVLTIRNALFKVAKTLRRNRIRARQPFKRVANESTRVALIDFNLI